MNKVRDTGLKIFFGFLLAILIFHYNDTAVRVSAATAVSYVFDMEGKTYQPDSEAEITRLNSSLFLKTKTGDPVSNSVKVKWESTEPAVATLEVANGTIDNQDIAIQYGSSVTARDFQPLRQQSMMGALSLLLALLLRLI